MNNLEPLESRLVLAAGTLDPSFGQFGQVVYAIESPDNDRGRAVVVQADGKVLVAGEASAAPGEVGLLVQRFNRDGSLDRSFGDGGRVRVRGEDGFTRVGAIALQGNGRILVAGTLTGTAKVVRLNANGSIDRSFGLNGVGAVASRFGNLVINSIAQLAGGKILLAGSVLNGAGDDGGTIAGAALVRLTADGRSDDAYSGGSDFYGRGGRLILDELKADIAATRVLGDGSVLAVGKSGEDFLLFKLTPGGELDLDFGDGGVVVTDFGGRADAARSVVVLKDGTIVVAGASGGDFAMARYAADGRSLVQGFGDGGRVRYDAGGTADVANAVGVDAEGRLILMGTAGTGGDGTGSVAVARFLVRGRFDRTFGDGGHVGFDFGGVSSADAGTIGPDGNVVVAGARGAAGRGDTMVARLSGDGRLDATFGVGGRVIAPTTSAAGIYAGSSARQADGRVVIAYRVTGRLGGNTGVTRFNVDGSLDQTFGAGGSAFFEVMEGTLSPVAVGPGGRIVLAAGTLKEAGAELELTALRADGRLDSAFGLNGHARFDFADFEAGIAYPRAIAFQGGRILVGGTFSDFYGEFSVARFTAGGALDIAFGGGDGVASASFNPDPSPNSGPRPASVTDIAFQSDGKIVAAGYQGRLKGGDAPPHDGFALARFLADGTLDATFGNGGKVTTDPATFATTTQAMAVTVLADGRIITTGVEEPTLRGSYPFGLPEPGDFVVSRYRADGSLDATYGDHGRLRIAFGDDNDDLPGGAIVRADGSVIVGGSSAGSGNDGGLAPISGALARITPAGKLDLAFGDRGRVLTRTGLDAVPHYVNYGAEESPFAPLPGADGSVMLAGASGDRLYLAKYLGDAAPAIAARIEGGVLKVRGTAAADRIVLRADGDAVEVVGLPQRFARAEFSRVEVDALAGEDLVDLSRLSTTARVDGGNGDDRILGGAADDSLLGGAGDDTLFGGGGRDTLRGGDGNDYLNGGPGADAIFGEAGNDQVFAADGLRDTIDGGPGFDRVEHDSNDLLVSGEGLLL